MKNTIYNLCELLLKSNTFNGLLYVIIKKLYAFVRKCSLQHIVDKSAKVW